MARANVELIVEAAKAINPLRKVEQNSKKVDQALKKNQKTVKRVEAAFVLFGRRGANALRDLEGNAARLGKSMGGLRGTIGKAAVAFAGFKSVQVGIARLESERRIQLLGKRFGEVVGLQNAAAQAAKKFKLSQTEANQSLANAFARLRPLGVSLEDITSTFGGFRTAAVLGGATAAEASAAFTQLSQALGSGALRGDEFRSIAEQAPLVLQAISDETGIAAGKLKEYAAQGLLTSDIVIKALKRIESDGAESLAQALNGPAAKIKEFQNAVEDVQVAATESAIPAITNAISELGTVIRQLEPAIRFIGGLLAGVAKTAGNIVENIAGGGKLAAAQLAARQATTLQTNAKFGAPGPGNRRSQEAREFEAETLKRELSRRLAILRGAVPGQLPPSAADIASNATGTSPITLPTKDSGGGAAAKERVDMSERMLELIRQRVELSRSGNEVAIAVKENEIETLSIQESSLRPRQRIAAQLKAEDALHNRLSDIHKKNLRLFNDQKRIAEEAGKAFAEDFISRAIAKTDLLKDALQGVGDILGNQMMNVFDGLINKTLDFNDVLRSTLSQVGKLLMTAGLNSLAGPQGSGGILSFLGFGTKANGGPVSGGQPYMVGERGPELFVPGQSGGVMRNEDMRSLMGRSPASGGAASMNFSFETTSIGGTEYVSREQLESAMAVTRKQASNDGAKRGMNMTLDKMQNSPRTRTRIGLR